MGTPRGTGGESGKNQKPCLFPGLTEILGTGLLKSLPHAENGFGNSQDRTERRSGRMKGFLKGMLLGAAADLALHTNTVKKTAAGKAMQTATDAVDAAAASVKETMNR